MIVRDGEAYLREAIDSILRQTFDDFELIILDDGSSDGTAALIQENARADPRIRALREERPGVGLSAALRRACAGARGTYIARMDADDVSLPDRLERQVRFLEVHLEVAVVGSAMRCMNGSRLLADVLRYPEEAAEIAAALPRVNCIAHPTVMMRREVYAATGGYRRPFRHAEDYDLWLRIAERHDLRNLPAPLLHYRFHEGQVTASCIPEQVIHTLGAQVSARRRRAREADPVEGRERIGRQDLLEMGLIDREIDRAILKGYFYRCDLVLGLGLAGQATRIVEEMERLTLVGSMTRRRAAEVAWLRGTIAFRAGRWLRGAGWIARACLRRPTTLKRLAKRWKRRSGPVAVSRAPERHGALTASPPGALRPVPRPRRVMLLAGAEVAGGLLTHVGILAAGLSAAGHAVHVVLSPAGGADDPARECAAAGAEVTRLSVRGKFDLTGIARLRRLVATWSPDVVHLHLSSPIEAVPALVAARLGGARRIVTTEHAPTWSPLRRFYSGAVKRIATRHLDAVIAVSEADARYLQTEFGLPPGILTVIPNGVPRFAPGITREAARARYGLPEGRVTIVGYLGALETKKGVMDLLAGAAGSGLPGLVVALAGEGSLAPELRRQAAHLPFTLVLPGRVRDAGDFLAGLDVFVLPSHQEAMPLALLEAMAAGLPIVAARVGGIPEALQQGAAGLLVTPARPEEIAQALRRLSRDGDLGPRLGAAAREAAERDYGADLMVRRVEALYGRLLDGGEGRRSRAPAAA